MEESRRRVALVLAVVAVVVIVTEGIADLPVRANQGNASDAADQTDGVWIAVYDGEMVNYTLHNLSSYLRPGDGIAIVMHNYSTNWTVDNGWAERLHAAFPDVTLRAYMSLDGGLDRAGGLQTTIGALSPLFTQVSGDWEVNGPVEFNATFNATTAYFQDFATVVRSTGRLAIGYPSGRGVLGDYSGPPFDWNYGTFAGYLDGMTIETQGLCLNASEWPTAVSRIWSEYNASGESTRTLSLQISLGVGGNGVNATEASYCANYWRGVDRGNLFLWWGPSQETAIVQVLQAIGR